MKTGTKITIGLAALFIIYNELQKRNSKPKVFVSNIVTGNYNARTIPPFGIFVKEEQKNNTKLIEHELIHWEQYRKKGLIKFYSDYAKYQSQLGYDLNPMEIEARLLTGEIPECINNYTECVRNGKALTVFNPNFRK